MAIIISMKQKTSFNALQNIEVVFVLKVKSLSWLVCWNFGMTEMLALPLGRTKYISVGVSFC